MTGPVLCAVDISNKYRDKGVLRRAAQLAELDGCDLDVITVLPDYGMSMVGQFFEKAHHDKAIEEARHLAREMIDANLPAEKAAKVNVAVATGRAYEEILSLAKKLDASLIVIGAHKPDFTDYLLGPNAARVVRHANCAVYVVR